MKRLLIREQVIADIVSAPLEAPIYSNVKGCPIDAMMRREDGLQRWMAVCLLLAQGGSNARRLAGEYGCSKQHVYDVLKGEIVDVKLMEYVAKQLRLPVEQVFCYDADYTVEFTNPGEREF